ncbi:MAG: phosphoribosylanthranilate isomerase [Ruminococcus sp.]|nr:phosphoribosylanthranilate isomerase [Ruminococcus sp.]
MSVEVKLCGMTTPEDIGLVNRLRPEYAGFVLFFPKSRRNLGLAKAVELKAQLHGVKAVAVTVSPTPEQAEDICSAGFDYIQIHGELYEETYSKCTIPIIRAFNDFQIGELARCDRLENVTAYLFDAAEPGSGKIFDWDKLAKLPRGGRRLFLAGGLTPENVAHAIATVRPDCVDVSSGIERPEGGKDAAKAEEFVKNARSVTEVQI